MSTEKKDKKEKKSGGGAGAIVALLLLLGIGGGVGLGGGAGIGGLLGNGNGQQDPAGPGGNGTAITTEAPTGTISDLTTAASLPEESSEAVLPGGTEDPVRAQLVIRIKGMELTVDGTVTAAEELKAVIQARYRDGMEVRLEDAYADSELYRKAADILKELTISYVEAADK